jgi:hypothetical protein
MPKQQQAQPWSDDEINKFLSSRGHNPATPEAPPGGTSAADPQATGYPPRPGVMDQIRSYLGIGEAPTGRPPTYGEMDWQQAAGQGAAREAASLGVGAARLAGRALPEGARASIGSALENVPGVTRLEQFADAPAEGPAEYLGSGAMDVVAGSAIPTAGLGNLAARAATRTTPVWVNPLGAGGRWLGSVANPRTVQAARVGGNVAEAAGKGALGGAITDPDDPSAGARHGAEAALGGRAIGGALRSRPVQEIAGTMGRYGIPTGIGYLLAGPAGAGIGGGLGAIANEVGKAARHSAHRYYSGIGQTLDRSGRAVFDSAGRFLGYLPATIGGEAARATSDRPMMTTPRRDTAPPPFELPEGQPDAQAGPQNP